jgi:hypothetical protein
MIGHLQRQGGPDCGRVQTQVRRCFAAHNGAAVPFSELLVWSYAGNRRPWRWQVYKALARYGEPVRHGWWRPNEQLRLRILGRSVAKR